MAMLSFGGIDVSKDRLDVVVLPEEECSSVPNDAAGWGKIRRQYATLIQESIRSDSIVAYFYSTASPR
jgi:hypothetical protein